VLFASTAAARPPRATPARERRDDQRGHRLPRPAEGDARQVHEPDGHKGQLVERGWDDLQTKIAAAAAANTYFADVTDVDWSKVGEYYVTKWFLPLNQYSRSAPYIPVPAAQLVRPERDACRDADDVSFARHDDQ